MTPELLALLDRILNPDTADGGPLTDEELAGLTDAELALLQAGIGDRADELADDRTPDAVAELQRAADGIERVGGVQDQRATEAEEREQAAQAARDRINARRPATDPEPEPDGEETPAEPETAPEPVAASGRRPNLGDMARRRAATQTRDRAPAPQTPPRRLAPLTAAGNVPGHAVGAGFTDIYDLAGAMNERMRTLGRGGTTGEQVIVASAAREYPAERTLRVGESSENTRRLGAVTDPEVVVAAGGFCAPAEVDYGVEVLGVTDRPVRDALPGFGADRGKIQFRKNLAFADYTGAIGDWTEQNDIDAATPGGSDPTKPCLQIACPDLSAAQVQARTLCLEFRNMTSRFDPEGTAAAIRAADVAYARYSENQLLAGMRSFAIDVTSAATGLGALRDLFAAFDHLFAYAESRWRLTGVRMRAAIPAWVNRLIALDQARGMHGGATELLSVTRDQINTWLRARGVEPIWHLDGMAAQTAATGVPAVAKQFYDGTSLTDAAALPGFPDTASIVCWYEGDVSYLDGGTLDLGIIRDSGLVASNAYRTFMEEFWGLAFRGQEMYHLVAGLQPRGGQAGTVDMSAATA
jgi:hypothetical protein